MEEGSVMIALHRTVNVRGWEPFAPGLTDLSVRILAYY